MKFEIEHAPSSSAEAKNITIVINSEYLKPSSSNADVQVSSTNSSHHEFTITGNADLLLSELTKTVYL